MQAQSLAMAGETENAMAKYEEMLGVYNSGRAYYAIWSVKTHYYLGLTYEDAGLSGKAATQYRIFLDLWRSADQKIDAVIDAEKRLQRLNSNP